jgi:hypothetical protein
VIYVPSFIKIGSGIQNVIRGDTQQRDLISHFIFQNKETRLKKRLTAAPPLHILQKICLSEVTP